MGRYNPYATQILGQEMVAIKDEDITLSPAANTREIGHTFNLETSRAVTDARFYIKETASGTAAGQTFFATIYNRGQEDQTGPIQRVVIPCNNGGVTGGFSVDAATVAIAMADPSDSRYISFSNSLATDGYFDAYFAVNSYAQELQGKRILGVNVLYALAGDLAQIAASGTEFLGLAIVNNARDAVTYGVHTAGTLPGDQSEGADPVTIYRMPMGEVDTWWSTTLSPNGTPNRMPWTYASLQRFEASSANRHAITAVYQALDLGDTAVSFHYMALEVIYCDENRVAVGGRSFGSLPGSGVKYQPYVIGQNVIPVLTPVAQGSVTLLAGEYTLVLSSADVGALYSSATGRAVNANPYPLLNGIREPYAIPTHAGIQVNVPFPMDDTAVGKTLTSEETLVLPQLSLHGASTALTEPHVYGRQAAAPVYGTITATQEIFDALGQGAQPYSQVRFYARRYGDTSFPLTIEATATPAANASITPAQLDALPEVLDGWREVTLRLSQSFGMGAGTIPQWRWISVGETVGNRYEVIGLTAPAVSGAVGNLKQLAPQQLSIATYGAPVSGANVNLGWKYPAVTATTDDQTSDASIIFSIDPLPVSGFGVTPTLQALETIDPLCAIDPACIATGLYYNALTWTGEPPSAYDDFNNRTLASSWGFASRSGGAWTNSGGAASDYNVTGGQGTHLLTTTNTARQSLLPGVGRDVDLTVIAAAPVAASGGALASRLVARYVDANNYYYAELEWGATQAVTVSLVRVVGGVATQLAAKTLTQTHAAGQRWNIRFQVSANNLRARAWLETSPEPPAWQVMATDTSLTTGQVGIRSIAIAPNVNVPVALSYDFFQADPYEFGSYEIQRFDTVDGEFTTIANITTPSITGFSDFEARVGYPSVYRIRATNVYDFAGLWSPQVTGTIPSPGVVGASVGLLILTTNNVQDGSSNLAYSSAWEGQVSETFTWPEGSQTTLQNMYGKNFPTAFRPLERGGEQFTRDVLVNAAGIPPAVTARGFESLRDLAWATVPYVCVRNEDGERWYSTILVSSGSMRRAIRLGRICIARVQVVEVTETPYPVDPE